MKMTINKKSLVIAIAGAGAVGVWASMAHAETFNASTTLQSTLSVTSLQDFDIGTVFATATGASYAEGVGFLKIAADGVVTPNPNTAVSLTSLGTPIPAQGSVSMIADFDLQLPDTNTIDEVAFDDGTGTALNLLNTANGATELVHESGNPSVPSLWLMHFTVGDVSGGTSAHTGANANDGTYTITQNFGETSFVFNIGATLTTQPETTTAQTYQEGIYSGTFEVTAAY